MVDRIISILQDKQRSTFFKRYLSWQPVHAKLIGLYFTIMKYEKEEDELVRKDSAVAIIRKYLLTNSENYIVVPDWLIWDIRANLTSFSPKLFNALKNLIGTNITNDVLPFFNEFEKRISEVITSPPSVERQQKSQENNAPQEQNNVQILRMLILIKGE